MVFKLRKSKYTIRRENLIKEIRKYNGARKRYISKHGEKYKEIIPTAYIKDYEKFAKDTKEYNDTIRFLKSFANSKNPMTVKVGSSDVPVIIANRAKKLANVEYANRQIEKDIKKRETERQGLPLASAEKYKARKRPSPETGGEFFKFMQGVTKWGSTEYINQKARDYKKNFLKGLKTKGLDNLDIIKEVIKEINSTDNITFFSSGFSYASLGIDFWYDSDDAANALRRWLDDFKDFKKTYGKE